MTRYTWWLCSLMLFACLLFTLVNHAVRFLLLCLRPSPALAAENLYLRKQLALYQEQHVKPKRTTNTDRLILVWLSRWFDWRKALAVMKPQTFIRWHCFTQLLERPLRRGMRRHIDVQQSAARMFDDHKDIEDAKGCRHCNTKVAGHNRLGMIPDEGRPSLGLHALAGPSVWALGHILAYGSRRDAEAELEQEHVRDAFLAPRRIITGHLTYERLQ